MTTILYLVLALLVLAVIYFALQLLLAKPFAIRGKQKEVDLLGGLVKLILWEANEGIVLLKNKQVSEVIYGPQAGGGTQFIFPLFGEELRIRVPLTLRLAQFEDANVLTRESTQLYLKVAFWWRIADLEKYYYVIGREVRVADDNRADDDLADDAAASPQGPRNAAERWILTLAESCIRKLVSQSTTAMVVSKNAAKYIHIDHSGAIDQSGAIDHWGTNGADRSAHGSSTSLASSRHQALPEGPSAANPENLAQAILHMLDPKVAEYGLRIDRVEIQEVRLPPELQEALDRLFRSHLLPAQSEQEVKARQIELQGIANVLGVQTVALKEVMKEFKGSTYVGGFPKFLETLFAKSQGNPGDQTALPAPPEEPTYALASPDDAPLLAAPKSHVEHVAHKCPKCEESVAVDFDPHGADKHFECPSCGAKLRTGTHRSIHHVE
jgi:regulator of protease activity HflC (stomatin/prohibitin superfamily)